MNLCAVNCLTLAVSALLGNLSEMGMLTPHRPTQIVLKLMQFSGDCFTVNLFWGKARYSKDLFNTSSNNEQFHCSWNRPFSGLIVVKSLLSWAFPQTCEARVYILCSLFRYEHEAADIKSLMSFSQKEERMDIRASYETQLAMRGHYIGEVSVGWKVHWASLAHGWRALAIQDGCCIPGASLHSTE